MPVGSNGDQLLHFYTAGSWQYYQLDTLYHSSITLLFLLRKKITTVFEIINVLTEIRDRLKMCLNYQVLNVNSIQ